MASNNGSSMTFKTLAFALFLTQLASGQFPGQYPGGYPPGGYPGGYPPGGYPGGGMGIPLPGRRTKSSDSSSPTNSKNSVNTSTLRGLVRELGDGKFTLESEDTRIIEIKTTDKTTKPKDLAIGDSVEVTAHDDGKGGFYADTIAKMDTPAKVEGAGHSGSRPSLQQNKGGATTTTDVAETTPASTQLKGPKYDDGDSGPPVLRRGRPAQTKSDDDDNTSQPAPQAPPDRPMVARAQSLERPPDAPPARDLPPARPMSSDPRQAFIEKAEEASDGFLNGLPNYVCQEYTTRYVSEGRDWHAMDIVSLDVLYIDGKEDYRNIQINGRPTKKPVQDSGAWSTGEFGTILADLFSPATAAKFKYVEDTTISGIPAHLYDFSVDRYHSHWHVQVEAQSILPSYKGSIWLDKKDARPLRIEMQATNIPAEFPEDSVESSVDYGYVSLGTDLGNQRYFVPLKAEVLSCQRGTNQCGKNVIEFRNYHKFTGESNIIFGK